jgi:hypothetical protein
MFWLSSYVYTTKVGYRQDTAGSRAARLFRIEKSGADSRQLPLANSGRSLPEIHVRKAVIGTRQNCV